MSYAIGMELLQLLDQENVTGAGAAIALL